MFNKESPFMLPIHCGSSPVKLLLERSKIEIEDADDSQSRSRSVMPIPVSMSLKRFILASQLAGPLGRRKRGLKERSITWRLHSLESSSGIGSERWFLERSST